MKSFTTCLLLSGLSFDLLYICYLYIIRLTCLRGEKIILSIVLGFSGIELLRIYRCISVSVLLAVRVGKTLSITQKS